MKTFFPDSRRITFQPASSSFQQSKRSLEPSPEPRASCRVFDQPFGSAFAIDTVFFLCITYIYSAYFSIVYQIVRRALTSDNTILQVSR